MSEGHLLMQHLAVGREQRARIDEALAAFRRLVPSDYGHFLAMIELDLEGASDHELDHKPRLVLDVPTTPAPPSKKKPAPMAAEAAETSSRATPLRELVTDLLSDGKRRTTAEIRAAIEAKRPINRDSLNTEIFTLRKRGFVRSEGTGNKRSHVLVAMPETTARSKAPRTPRAPKAARRRATDDDEDHRAPGAAPDAAKIYARTIADHHLLSKEEECALSSRLEEVEVAIWDRLLAGPVASDALAALRALDPPVNPRTARQARVADLDRLVAARVIAAAGDRLPHGDRAALADLVAEADRVRARFASCNLRMVPATIRRHGYHLTTSLSMGDLIQEGNLGLLKAIPRFDHRRGFRFSTFATWWIRHHLVRGRQNLTAEVRVPVHMQELAGRVRRKRAELARTLGRDPTRAEVAAALGVSMKSLASLEGDWLKHRESLPVFDSVGDVGAPPAYLASDDARPDEVLARHQAEGSIAAAVAALPPYLGQILRWRFGLDGADPETLFQIGARLRLSRERIRQLEKKALAFLRDQIGDEVDVTALVTA